MVAGSCHFLMSLVNAFTSVVGWGSRQHLVIIWQGKFIFSFIVKKKILVCNTTFPHFRFRILHCNVDDLLFYPFEHHCTLYTLNNQSPHEYRVYRLHFLNYWSIHLVNKYIDGRIDYFEFACMLILLFSCLLHAYKPTTFYVFWDWIHAYFSLQFYYRQESIMDFEKLVQSMFNKHRESVVVVDKKAIVPYKSAKGTGFIIRSTDTSCLVTSWCL